MLTVGSRHEQLYWRTGSYAMKGAIDGLNQKESCTHVEVDRICMKGFNIGNSILRRQCDIILVALHSTMIMLYWEVWSLWKPALLRNSIAFTVTHRHFATLSSAIVGYSPPIPSNGALGLYFGYYSFHYLQSHTEDGRSMISSSFGLLL